MSLVMKILPYAQIILSVMLVTAILLQQSAAGLVDEYVHRAVPAAASDDAVGRLARAGVNQLADVIVPAGVAAEVDRAGSRGCRRAKVAVAVRVAQSGYRNVRRQNA